MSAATSPDTMKLAENVMHFARVLRRAGLPIGPAKVVDALQALQAVGVERRDDFYFALSAVLVNRHEHQAVFDQAFRLFWREPYHIDTQLEELLRLLRGVRRPARSEAALAQRVAHALLPNAPAPRPREDLPPDLSIDATLTVSSRELLQKKDFATMTPQELADARRMIARMRLPLPELPSRRSLPRAHGGQVDLRNTMKQMMREAGGIVELRRKAPRRRPPALVILCDISGSMDSYTRMLLHFAHAITNDRDRVHTFLFGTRLSNITRALRDRDVDLALDAVSRQVADWSGGTRIGACLHAFNQRWARRLMGQGAVVLLISDGLDSDAAAGLGKEMEQLKLASRRLIWLNPLLRYARFEAKPAGIRAMLPHVDLFLPVHNLASLSQLGEALREWDARRANDRRLLSPPQSSGE
ncbi:vWA domain-containing protein [Noviherbaspirillum massiliense]|uniref:vWA domain-containing protein n=1 Tax=Noviherbaspirillum massiliense TaxID=1465823 RepID=UPI000381FD15|nr:VWA domain-containing protein [Noviherbaspirillum massiliense]